MGTSTFLPLVSRESLTTRGDGPLLMVMTPNNSGIAACSLWMQTPSGPSPTPQSQVGVIYPYIFPKVTSSDTGNLPTSARPARYGYRFRNTTDQLKLGGTVRVLRLSTGVALPTGDNSSPEWARQFDDIVAFIKSHPDTAQYSGNQLVEGNGQAAVPSNQTKYMDYDPWIPTPADAGGAGTAVFDPFTGNTDMPHTTLNPHLNADFKGGPNHAYVEQLRKTGHATYRIEDYVSQQTSRRRPTGTLTLGDPVPATANGTFLQLDSDLQQTVFAADSTDAYIKSCLDPAMSVQLVLFERRPQDSQNTYDFTFGAQYMARYPANNLLQTIARKNPTAPLPVVNKMRSAGEKTKSFLTQISDVGFEVSNWLVNDAIPMAGQAIYAGRGIAALASM